MTLLTPKLILQRLETVNENTFGELYWFTDPDLRMCWTLEDAVREHKISGRTAIPEGIYKIRMLPSRRFKRMMPFLMDVPGFYGVMIHPGNTVHDTSGCILVGKGRTHMGLTRSREAFEELYRRIQEEIESALAQQQTPDVCIKIGRRVSGPE